MCEDKTKITYEVSRPAALLRTCLDFHINDPDQSSITTMKIRFGLVDEVDYRYSTASSGRRISFWYEKKFVISNLSINAHISCACSYVHD